MGTTLERHKLSIEVIITLHVHHKIYSRLTRAIKYCKWMLQCICCNQFSFVFFYLLFLSLFLLYYYTPRKLCLPPANFVCGGVYCFHVVRLCVRPCVRPSVRPSVTFCFLNILKSQCWNFIKLCKHINICKTNTFNKKGKG